MTARPNQIPPKTGWLTWLVLSGRGWGKTRVAAEWMAARAIERPGWRGAVIAPTFASARDVCFEGESGLLAVLRRYISSSDLDKVWNRSIGELTLPNGSNFRVYSAEEPDRLRGPQHNDAWCDELAAWPKAREVWDMLQMGLRLPGADPQTVIATTPRPLRLLKDLMEDPSTLVTRGSTYENSANLAPKFFDQLKRYEGTRLGRQELLGEILSETPGALWHLAQLDTIRIPAIPPCSRIVIAIDPAVSATEQSDETGIVACGLSDGRLVVLADRSGKYQPAEWASIARDLFYELKADRMVAESNQGGEMVAYTLATIDPRLPVTLIHASRGKLPRAEPIAALYERGIVSHVSGLIELEEQMTAWNPGDPKAKSPDRVDAMVHAMTELVWPSDAQRVEEFEDERVSISQF